MIISITELGIEKANKYTSAINMLEAAGMKLGDQYDRLDADIDILITLKDYEDPLDTVEESWDFAQIDIVKELIESGHIEESK